MKIKAVHRETGRTISAVPKQKIKVKVKRKYVPDRRYTA